MNEIIGPIYYVFATDSNTEWRGKLQGVRGRDIGLFCYTSPQSFIITFSYLLLNNFGDLF